MAAVVKPRQRGFRQEDLSVTCLTCASTRGEGVYGIYAEDGIKISARTSRRSLTPRERMGNALSISVGDIHAQACGQVEVSRNVVRENRLEGCVACRAGLGRVGQEANLSISRAINNENT